MKAWLLALLLAAPTAWGQTVSVTGMVSHGGKMELSTLRQAAFSGSFNSMSGRQTHRWTGPLLLDVLNQAGVTDAPG